MTATALPPGPRAPAAAQAAAWFARPTSVLERCQQRHGDVFTLRLGPMGPWVVLAEPALVKQVFAGDPDVLHAGEANAVAEPLLGSRSVLLLDGAAHLHERRLLLPPFHGAALARLEDVVRDVTRRHVARWPLRRVVPTRPLMQDLTLEVIMRAVFGVHDAARMRELHDRLVALLEWLARPRNIALGLALGPQHLERVPAFTRARGGLDALLFEEIARRRAADDLEERADVLSLLLRATDEDGAPLEDRRVRDHLVTVLGAGHETTATALAWACHELARAPYAAARIRDGDRAFLDATVQEVLRLRPVIPGVGRRLKAPVQLGRWSLPADVSLVPAVHLVHRRPDLHPDPLVFRPERWLGPAGRRTAAGVIGFGGGVRRCLGAGMAQLELRVVLDELCRVRALAPDRRRPEPVRRRGVTLAPARGGRIALHA